LLVVSEGYYTFERRLYVVRNEGYSHLVLASTCRCPLYSLAGTFHRIRSRLLKTGFFRQVREVKIQMKNPGCAVRVENRYKPVEYVEH
jgi:hypothetical protein